MPRETTIAEILLKQARLRPDDAFVGMFGHATLSYGQMAAAALRVAGGLSAIGVKPDETVVILADTSVETVAAWLGIGFAGGIEVWINSGYRGSVLEHALKITSAATILIGERFLPALLEVQPNLPLLRNIVVLGAPEATRPDLADVEYHEFQRLIETAPLPVPKLPVRRPSDIASVIFTSGTSGPAKGVMMPQGQVVHLVYETVSGLGLEAGDICYCAHPLYHMAGKFMGVLSTMAVGGSVVLDSAFQPGRWLERIRASGATVTLAHGPMIEMIHGEPKSAADRNHAVRRMMACPMPRRIAADFEQRFGIRQIEVYGMTEIGAPCWTPADTDCPAGSSGRVDMEDYDFKVVDPDTDEEVLQGTIGEFVFRPKKPWMMMQGYMGMPDKTVEAWRNMWFHTGDSGFVDADGYLFYVDRLGDRIRRRGENIASYDIEAAAQTHPAVRECAAVGIPSEFEGDDDILLALVLTEDAVVTPEALLGFLAEQLPHFMVPRYIQFCAALPRTPLGKIQKSRIRSGFDDGAWDRKQAGISLRQLRAGA